MCTGRADHVVLKVQRRSSAPMAASWMSRNIRGASLRQLQRASIADIGAPATGRINGDWSCRGSIAFEQKLQPVIWVVWVVGRVVGPPHAYAKCVVSAT